MDDTLRTEVRRIVANLAVALARPCSSRDVYIAFRRAARGMIALYDAKYGIKSESE